MNDYLKYTFDVNSNQSSKILPEFSPRFSTALFLDDFRLSGSEMESWDSLGFSHLQKSQAMGKNGRGSVPESFAYETGRVHEKHSQHPTSDQGTDFTQKQQEHSGFNVVENAHFSLGTDSYSTVKNVEQMSQRMYEEEKSSSLKNTLINDDFTLRAAKLKRHFVNQNELSKKHKDNIDSTEKFVYGTNKKHNLGPDFSESIENYINLKNKYAVLSESVSPVLYESVLQNNNDLQEKVTRLQQEAIILNKKEQQLVEEIINQSLLESKTTNLAVKKESTNTSAQNRRTTITISNAHAEPEVHIPESSDKQPINNVVHNENEQYQNKMDGTSLINLLKKSAISSSSSKELEQAIFSCFTYLKKEKPLPVQQSGFVNTYPLARVPQDKTINNKRSNSAKNTVAESEFSLHFLENHGASKSAITELKQLITSAGKVPELQKMIQMFFIQLQGSLNALALDPTTINKTNKKEHFSHLDAAIINNKLRYQGEEKSRKPANNHPITFQQNKAKKLRNIEYQPLISTLKNILQFSAAGLSNDALEQRLLKYIEQIKKYSLDNQRANSNQLININHLVSMNATALQQLTTLKFFEQKGVKSKTINRLNVALMSLTEKPRTEIIALLKTKINDDHHINNIDTKALQQLNELKIFDKTKVGSKTIENVNLTLMSLNKKPRNQLIALLKQTMANDDAKATGSNTARLQSLDILKIFNKKSIGSKAIANFNLAFMALTEKPQAKIINLLKQTITHRYHKVNHGDPATLQQLNALKIFDKKEIGSKTIEKFNLALMSLKKKPRAEIMSLIQQSMANDFYLTLTAKKLALKREHYQEINHALAILNKRDNALIIANSNSHNRNKKNSFDLLKSGKSHFISLLNYVDDNPLNKPLTEIKDELQQILNTVSRGNLDNNEKDQIENLQNILKNHNDTKALMKHLKEYLGEAFWEELKEEAELKNTNTDNVQARQEDSKAYLEQLKSLYLEQIKYQGKFGQAKTVPFLNSHEIKVKDLTQARHRIPEKVQANTSYKLFPFINNASQDSIPNSVSAILPDKHFAAHNDQNISTNTTDFFHPTTFSNSNSKHVSSKGRFAGTQNRNSKIKVNVGRVTYLSEDEHLKNTIPFSRPVPTMKLADYHRKQGRNS